MNFRKNSKGITLIALVVTIIVLLILAGVSLSLVAGSNGIITKATKAADANAVATAKEQVTLQIAEWTTEFYDRVYVQKDVDVNTKAGDWIYGKHHESEANPNLTTDEYRFIIESAPSNDTDNKGNAKYRVRVLKQYGDPLKTEERIKEDIKGYLTQDGILSWTSSGSTTGGSTPATPTYTAYSVGDEVELKSDSNEHFYVIKDSGEDEEKVTLLAKKNIGTTSLAQSDSAGTVAFSSTNYWSSISGITYPYDLNNTATSAETDAIAKAKAYGTAKGGTGRLMTVGEVVALGGDMDNLDISACPSWINSSYYWLGSADDANCVWCVRGEFSRLIRSVFGSGYFFGVRPVIEISKSLIQ